MSLWAQLETLLSVLFISSSFCVKDHRVFVSPLKLLYYFSVQLLEDETPTELAEKIRADIKEATGCTASVGIAANVLLARMCTRVAKPDGCYHLSANDDINQFMGTYLLGRKLLQCFPRRNRFLSRLGNGHGSWLIGL